jgi:hypothetical protein
LRYVAFDQVVPFLSEIVKEFPRILELWRREKWIRCLPTLFLKHAEDGPELQRTTAGRQHIRESQ